MTKVLPIDELLIQVRQLTPLEKVRLIEEITPQLGEALQEREPSGPSRSLLGICKHLGDAPSAAEIDEARREAWSGFPRDDI